MRIQVRLFAFLKEALGKEQLELELAPGATVADLYEKLAASDERFARYDRKMAFAVNGRHVAVDAPLEEGDEVALLPPVSGGLA